ncbi:MAG: hypothetical protein WA919_15940, partial [Coleofasciculaceae cyanobacterium]
MHVIHPLSVQPLTELSKAVGSIVKLLIFGLLLPFEQSDMEGILADIDAQWDIRLTHDLRCSWNEEHIARSAILVN